MSPLVQASLRTGDAALADARRKSQGARRARPTARSTTVPGAARMVSRNLPVFSRQVSAMLAAGVPIVDALNSITSQTGHPQFGIVIESVKLQIESGSSFSEALERYPTVFNDQYVSMIKAGEESGRLAETLARLATFLESKEALAKRVKAALTYPTVVVCVALAITALIVTFVVPAFAGMFASFNAPMPPATQFLVNIAHWTQDHFVVLSVGGFLLGLVGKRWKRSKSGAMALDRIALALPVVSQLVQMVVLERLSRTLAQLVRSGVPILRALEIASATGGNKVVEAVVLEARERVEEGDKLSAALRGHAVMPDMLVEMLAVGEKVGKIDEMLDSVADYYANEVNTALTGLTAALEPALMTTIGIIIGGIVVCMFLPLFKIVEHIVI